MPRFRSLVALLLLTSAAAHAQDMPFDRITPPQSNDAAMMTTHDAPPVEQATEEPKPNFTLPAPGTQAMPASPPPFSTYQGKIPFGRAESSGPVIPSGPRNVEAVPVVGVDAVEASEAAPPTPPPPGSDPAQEDPAEPTDLTSPIFEAEPSADKIPRKILIRALNKVTAQAALLTLKPGETVKFGQLEITAQTCRTSAPTSQTDYAAYLDIVEQIPKMPAPKALFHGWMYASSPSITSLEHPVYDVTMVECKAVPTTPAPEEKSDKKPAKKAKN